jgi:hypothetical protein
VADDDALDDLADEVLLMRREAARGFELQSQLLVGTPLGLLDLVYRTLSKSKDFLGRDQNNGCPNSCKRSNRPIRW